MAHFFQGEYGDIGLDGINGEEVSSFHTMMHASIAQFKEGKSLKKSQDIIWIVFEHKSSSGLTGVSVC